MHINTGFVPAGEQAELLPCDAEMERVLGVSLRSVEGMDKSVRQVLGADTSAISTLRCLKLYLERLGCDFQHAPELQRIAGQTRALHSGLNSIQAAAYSASGQSALLWAGMHSRPGWPCFVWTEQH